MDVTDPRTFRALALRLSLGAAGLLALAVAAAFAVPLPSRMREAGSVVVEYRDGSPAHVFITGDDKWRVPVELQTVDPAYVGALLRLEDKRFRRHFGVDPLAILRAAFLDVVHLERVSGGSTLTMQLVRVLEPRPRTLRSKVVEALRATQLELRMSKDELLTAYLQFVPYGRNLEGVESAALAYFGHGARHLSAAEIATLLAVPQNPGRRFPQPENEARLRQARDGIAQRLFDAGALRVARNGTLQQALAEVRATAVPTALRPFPREAPHAAEWLRAQVASCRIRTTLDGGAQRLLQRLLDQERPQAEQKGIHNAAAVLADHDRAQVLALAGNFDFFDGDHGGQIIGFATPRSPGSALKPFLYAFAIDRGLANPQMLVADVPVTYGAYAPHNFDGQFSGLVRLEDALSRSLNIPFVTLLEKLGVEDVLGRLRRMGVSSLSPVPGYYGLSLAVGGSELSPLELAGLYAALAGEGRYRPLRTLASQEEVPGFAAFSPGAAYLTREALSLRERPDFPERKRMNGAPSGVHWKTGTSFGHRDAWAAGSLGALTAVVWMGNFDNSPSVHLVGAEAAGPLLFDLLEGAADKSRRPLPPRVPGDLTSVEVCAYSGQLATEACPRTTRALALRRAVPTAKCPYHVALDVDVATGQALSPTCRQGHKFERRTFVVFPAAVRRFLDEQQRLLPEPPVLAPGCEAAAAHAPPSIVSPAAGQVAILLRGVATDAQEIPLEAETRAADETLTWFVDGQYLGTSRADERVWWKPSEGVHEIYVADSSGLSSRRRLLVRSQGR